MPYNLATYKWCTYVQGNLCYRNVFISWWWNIRYCRYFQYGRWYIPSLYWSLHVTMRSVSIYITLSCVIWYNDWIPTIAQKRCHLSETMPSGMTSIHKDCDEDLHLLWCILAIYAADMGDCQWHQRCNMLGAFYVLDKLIYDVWGCISIIEACWFELKQAYIIG